jgi:autotransporter translocation and assembly factor TamB
MANLSATGDELELAAYFLPETIELIEGPFSVSAALEGTPRLPRINGQAHLRSSTIKAVDIVNPIEDVQIDLVFRQDTIEIQRAAGTIRDKGRTGTVNGGGTLRILGYNEFEYGLTLKGRKVPARFEAEDFYVESDFDLTVSGVTPPLVSGTITPKRVEDRAAFDEEETEVVLDTTIWDWDMSVELPGNYWIHNDQIDAELSADLRLLRNQGRPIYLGTAEIIRGKVYLFDKIGRIKRGVLTFDDTNTPDPQLDIDVEFRIRQPRPDPTEGVRGSPDIDLKLHVGGRASEPLIQPEEGYTEQDVLLLLAANSQTGSDPWSDRLKFAATGLLFSEVQRVAARKLGLETLEINSNGGTAGTEITVGRYFSPHLYLYGSSPIDAASGQEVGFEYRLNRRLHLEGNRDKDSQYRLNLHLNWDY